MTNLPREPIHVAALIYDGLCEFEYGIVAEIFGLARPELGAPLYTFQPVAIEIGPLRSRAGLTVSAPDGLDSLKTADLIIIPGWRGGDAPVPPRAIAALQKAYQEGRAFLTICSGVYVLAEAGLLDGRHVTTHWRYADDFAARYPNVGLKTEALYQQDGPFLTSAGSAAGLDACLHRVRMDYGAKIANNIARRLVMHAHREGGQAQFIERPLPKDAASDRLAQLLTEIRTGPQKDWSIDHMAKAAGLSPRTLQRRFVELTGSSPRQWLTGLRLDQACHLLESTALPIDHIARKVGFRDRDGLHYHFVRRFDLTPSSYRARFTHRPQSFHPSPRARIDDT